VDWDESEHPRSQDGRFTDKWVEAVAARLPGSWLADDLETSDAYLAELFGEPAIRKSGRRQPHPRSGFEVKVGRHRRYAQPESGEAPIQWIVDEHGEDFDRLFPDLAVAREPIGHVYRAMALSEPAVIVRLRVEPDDEWFAISADAYPRTRKRIPIDRVEAVSAPMRMGVDPGSRYGRRRLERLT
jgi:hypothetical protein